MFGTQGYTFRGRSFEEGEASSTVWLPQGRCRILPFACDLPRAPYYLMFSFGIPEFGDGDIIYKRWFDLGC